MTSAAPLARSIANHRDQFTHACTRIPLREMLEHGGPMSPSGLDAPNLEISSQQPRASFEHGALNIGRKEGDADHRTDTQRNTGQEIGKWRQADRNSRQPMMSQKAS